MNADVENRAHSLFAPRPFAAWLALAVTLSFPDVILGFGSFVLRDFSTFGYPLAAFHKASFWQGEIPFWNPLVYCGVPHMAQWNTMVFYPGSLIYLLLPVSVPLALSWFCLLHMYAGGLGLYFLVRSQTGREFPAAVAGFAFAFSGLVQHSLMWPNNIAALGLMPWVVLAVLPACQLGGRRLFWAIGVGGAQMLTGAPEMILFTWFMAGGAVLVSTISHRWQRWQKTTQRLLGIVVAVAGLAAVQLLPFFDLAAHSLRISHGQELRWTASSTFWINLFLPMAGANHFTNGVVYLEGQEWINSIYLGLPLLWLTLIAMQARHSIPVRAATLSILACILLALGPKGFAFSWINQLVPLDAMRYPIKFLVPIFFLLPLLAAKGAAELERADQENRPGKKSQWLALTIIVALAGCSMIMIGTGRRELDPTLSLTNGLVRLAWLIVGVALLHFSFHRPDHRMQRWLQLGFVVVIWWDLKTHLPALAPTVPPRIYQVENEGLAALNPAPEPGRGRLYRLPETIWRTDTFTDEGMDMSLLLLRAELAPNLNFPRRAAIIGGFLSLWFPMWEGIGDLLIDRSGRINDELADFLAISHTNSPEEIAEWRSRPTAHGWVTVGMAPRFATRREALQRIADGWWDSDTEVFLERKWQDKIAAEADPKARISELEFGDNHVRFEVACQRPTTAAVAQFHHHWWKAAIDGRDIPVMPANLGFQAIAIPAGTHTVELNYRDGWFRLGATISGLTLMICLLLFRVWRPEGPEVPAQD